ncbi:MAG: hypothetical protein WC003_12200 [Terrimicrobiaceae bacterium]
MMNPADLVEILRSALTRICEPRLFETERGYQAELLAEIQHVLKQQKDDAVIDLFREFESVPIYIICLPPRFARS